MYLFDICQPNLAFVSPVTTFPSLYRALLETLASHTRREIDWKPCISFAACNCSAASDFENFACSWRPSSPLKISGMPRSCTNRRSRTQCTCRTSSTHILSGTSAVDQCIPTACESLRVFACLGCGHAETPEHQSHCQADLLQSVGGCVLRMIIQVQTT